MAGDDFERARARARPALVAPTVDDVSARYFEELAKVIFEEARRRGLNPDDELLFKSLEAIAKKYFAKELQRGDLM